MFAGFPGGVRSYDLHWGVASAIDNSGVTVAQRMQVVTAPTLAPTLVIKQEEDWPYCKWTWRQTRTGAGRARDI